MLPDVAVIEGDFSESHLQARPGLCLALGTANESIKREWQRKSEDYISTGNTASNQLSKGDKKSQDSNSTGNT